MTDTQLTLTLRDMKVWQKDSHTPYHKWSCVLGTRRQFYITLELAPPSSSYAYYMYCRGLDIYMRGIRAPNIQTAQAMAERIVLDELLEIVRQLAGE